jgi:hypothetical protein
LTRQVTSGTSPSTIRWPSLRPGGLANAGFADQQGVVLATTTQHLNGAFDFLSAADQRIDLALTREFIEIGSVFGQWIGLGIFASPSLPCSDSADFGAARSFPSFATPCDM